MDPAQSLANRGNFECGRLDRISGRGDGEKRVSGTTEILKGIAWTGRQLDTECGYNIQ